MSFNRRYMVVLFGAFLVACLCGQADAYIGPGAGFAVAGSLLAVLAALFSAFVVIFTWPVRLLVRAIRGRGAYKRSKIKRLVVLGLDGMDPKLACKMMDEGKLPNLDKIRRRGCFKELATTVPSISPVAWSSFQTGVNPGKHNIFDFLTRNKRTYRPALSSVVIRGPARKLRIGRYQIPLSKPDIRLLRKAKPFWQILGKHGIFSSVIRVPVTFPPEKFAGVQLSGMCVPDLRGKQGMFSYYSTEDLENIEHTGGQNYKLRKKGNSFESELVGSQNPFRTDGKVLKCRFELTVIDEITARLKVNGEKYILEKAKYSPWLKVAFRVLPGVKVYGICKFLLLNTEPAVRLYVTPINIDPARPAMPISHPRIYSTYLARRQGSFATLGLAEDSWALNEKVLVDESFIRQCCETDKEREKMFFDALDKTRRGLCVCVFDGTDRIQHTFWRNIDPEHPVYKPADDGDSNPIEQLYRRMDVLAGKTFEKCDRKNTVFMIISDHGFNTFRHGVDLNRWLEENGYLKLNQKDKSKKHLAGVDWSRTRAFAIGLAGIYLNIKGRESQGIVDGGEEAEQLRIEIASRLRKLINPGKNNQQVIKEVYNSNKIYSGPYKNDAPDLIVGYQKGYRASWETAIGQVTDEIFHDNTKAWSGDHCIDPDLVPGVLFCNRQIDTAKPSIVDIGPTVLDMFGVDVPKQMDGRVLAVTEERGNNHETDKK